GAQRPGGGERRGQAVRDVPLGVGRGRIVRTVRRLLRADARLVRTIRKPPGRPLRRSAPPPHEWGRSLKIQAAVGSTLTATCAAKFKLTTLSMCSVVGFKRLLNLK